MVNYTPNLNLAKPILSDVADITVISANFDILDSALAKMVTTDSPQEITGSKTFSGTVMVNGHNLRNAVTTDETQTITGSKQMTNVDNNFKGQQLDIRRKSYGSNIIIGRNEAIADISTNLNFAFIDFNDGANVNFGDIFYFINKGGTTSIGGEQTPYTRARITAKSPNATNPLHGIEIFTGDNNKTEIIIPTVPNGAGSGAVVNKAYVESTDGVTNNLVHRSADETIGGTKTFEKKTNIAVNLSTMNFSTGADPGQWRKIGEITPRYFDRYSSLTMTFLLETGFYNSNKGGVGMFYFVRPYDGNPTGLWLMGKSELADIMSALHIAFAERSDGVIDVMARGRAYTSYWLHCISVGNGGTRYLQSEIIKPQVATIVSAPVASDYVHYTEIVGVSQ